MISKLLKIEYIFKFFKIVKTFKVLDFINFNGKIEVFKISPKKVPFEILCKKMIPETVLKTPT